MDDDPWGLPYRLVLDRLRLAGPSLTEVLDEDVLNRTLSQLFPRNESEELALEALQEEVREGVPSVSVNEITAIIRRKQGRNTAPGRDGIPLKAIGYLPEEGFGVLASLFTKCLEEGRFPKEWKRAILVLIPKQLPVDGDNPKVRPICLLDELGKILETVLVDRIWNWMEENPESQLAEDQYGFRRHRSTCDALSVVCADIQRVTGRGGGVLIAVGLDIKNAFNSLPWSAIREAMRKKGFPKYIRRMIGSYLSNRSIEYVNNRGEREVKLVTAGVPQGSVLGPVLWDITYDQVLQAGTEEDCRIVCFADDTMIMACAAEVKLATTKANIQTGLILDRIRRLGLEVAPQKTKAVCFRGRKRLDRTPLIDIDRVKIETKKTMRYLGVILDEKLIFEAHLDYVKGKVASVSRALCRCHS